MELTGLPLHPLIVHATVALVPLCVVVAWLSAFLPRSRWFTRWLALALALAAGGVVYLTKESGEALLDARPGLTAAQSSVRDLVETHEDRAELLWIAVLVFAVLVLLAFVALPASGAPGTSRFAHRGVTARWTHVAVPVSLVAAGAVVLVLLVLTGDAGARAVWDT